MFTTLDAFKQWADIEADSVDAERDAAITEVLEATAEEIIGHCGRDFTATAAEARTFCNGSDSRYLEVDEFHGTPTATINGDAITVTPVVVQGRPSSVLRGSFGYHNDVIVTATYGWETVPYSVELANKMLGLKLWERRKSPDGTRGNADMGFIRIAGIDRDIEALLAPFVRLGAFLA